MGMVVHLLSQYKDVISSIVREVSSNAIDSHNEARDLATMTYNKVIETYPFYAETPRQEVLDLQAHCADKEIGPIKVSIENAEFLDDDPILAIEDNGVGISPERFNKIFSSYFSSTKNETNNQIGAFGLGAKSPLGYARLFTLITYYNGWQYRYMIHKGEEVPIAVLEGKEETDKPNGTRVEVAIKEGDVPLFQKACRTQLAYFPHVEFYNANIEPDVEILIGKHFAVRSDAEHGSTYDYRYSVQTRTGTLHLCIGHVAYPLDIDQVDDLLPDKLSMRRIQDVGMALRFSNDEFDNLDLVWNRESVEYSPKTKRAIVDKMVSAVAELRGLAADQKRDHTDPIAYLKDLGDNQDGRTLLLGKCAIPGVGALLEICYPLYKGSDLGIVDWTGVATLPDTVVKIRSAIGHNGKAKLSKYNDPTPAKFLESIVNAADGKPSSYLHYLVEEDETVTHGKALTIHQTVNNSSKSKAYIWAKTTFEAYDERVKGSYYNRKAQISHEEDLLRRAFVDDLFVEIAKKGLATEVSKVTAMKAVRNTTLDAEIKDGKMCSRHCYSGRVSTYSYRGSGLTKTGFVSGGNSRDRDGWDQFNDFPIATHEKFVHSGRLLVYGLMEEEELLFAANRILTCSDVSKDNYLVIKISQENAKHMQHIDAVHVQDFLLMRVPQSRIIRQVLSRMEIIMAIEAWSDKERWGFDDILEALVESKGEWGVLARDIKAVVNWRPDNQLTQEIWEFYEDLEKFRSWQKDHFGHTQLDTVINLDLVKNVRDIILLMEQFPLLKCINTGGWLSTCPEEVDHYLALKENRRWVLRARKKRQQCSN
jgi:hypothetical protein